MANVLNAILTHEAIAKQEVFTRPTTRLVTDVLKLLQKKSYIGEFELIEDGRGGVYRIKLTHKINKCGVVKPRFPVTLGEYEKFEQRFLPARDVGMLIVSTPKGVMSNIEAKQAHLGGVLLAFVY